MKGKPQLDRERAMRARPERLPVIRTEPLPGGGLNVTVRFLPRPWIRLFGKTKPVDRTFALDSVGGEVYHACDGKTDVRLLIRRFAEAHSLSLAEAEISVTTFLNTLVSKGLVGMVIDRKPEP